MSSGGGIGHRNTGFVEKIWCCDIKGEWLLEKSGYITLDNICYSAKDQIFSKVDTPG